jgi:hypothetical protein
MFCLREGSQHLSQWLFGAVVFRLPQSPVAAMFSWADSLRILSSLNGDDICRKTTPQTLRGSCARNYDSDHNL